MPGVGLLWLAPAFTRVVTTPEGDSAVHHVVQFVWIPEPPCLEPPSPA